MRLFLALLLLSAPAGAQSAWQPGHAGLGFVGQAADKQWVQLDSSTDVTLHSTHGELPLRFVIQSGLHINSHTPHSAYLIPTSLELESPAQVNVGKITYPPGKDFHLAFSPNEALSVYTGEFAVLAPVHARAGHYTLHGRLNYQACDNRACNPPKSLPVTLNLTVE